jgi:hypothetical protein
VDLFNATRNTWRKRSESARNTWWIGPAKARHTWRENPIIPVILGGKSKQKPVILGGNKLKKPVILGGLTRNTWRIRPQNPVSDAEIRPSLLLLFNKYLNTNTDIKDQHTFVLDFLPGGLRSITA